MDYNTVLQLLIGVGTVLGVYTSIRVSIARVETKLGDMDKHTAHRLEALESRMTNAHKRIDRIVINYQG